MRLQQDPQYRRLPVAQRSIGRSVSFWIAADHLLVVDVDGFVERYRRYPLDDLRAVVVRPTRTGRVLALVLGGLMLVSWVVLAVVLVFATRGGFPPESLPFLVIAGIPAALLLVATVTALLRISTGEAVLVTTTHAGRIPGITRLGTARRLAEVLAAETARRVPAADGTTPETPG